MTNGISQAAIHILAELLKVQKDPTGRMDALEMFDEAFGASIPDWAAQVKGLLQNMDGCEDAIKSIEEFYSKYHVYDENGQLVYERMRIGNSYHTITITYDSNAPEEEQFKIEETPDFDSMSIQELRDYYAELASAFSDLEDDEPEEGSEGHDEWEEEYSELESLMEEVQERIEEESH